MHVLRRAGHCISPLGGDHRAEQGFTLCRAAKGVEAAALSRHCKLGHLGMTRLRAVAQTEAATTLDCPIHVNGWEWRRSWGPQHRLLTANPIYKQTRVLTTREAVAPCAGTGLAYRKETLEPHA